MNTPSVLPPTDLRIMQIDALLKLPTNETCNSELQIQQTVTNNYSYNDAATAIKNQLCQLSKENFASLHAVAQRLFACYAIHTNISVRYHLIKELICCTSEQRDTIFTKTIQLLIPFPESGALHENDCLKVVQSLAAVLRTFSDKPEVAKTILQAIKSLKLSKEYPSPSGYYLRATAIHNCCFSAINKLGFANFSRHLEKEKTDLFEPPSIFQELMEEEVGEYSLPTIEFIPEKRLLDSYIQKISQIQLS